MKFDILGNFYLMDTSFNVYAKNSKTKILLKGIKDFAVNVQGQIYAISLNITQSDSS